MVSSQRDRSVRTRRAVVAGLGAAGVGLAVAARGGAQEATPTPLPTGMAEWIAGWQARDADRVAGAYTADGVHEVVATGQVFEGHDALRASVAAILAAIPDATVTANGAFAAGDAGAIDWTFVGTYAAQYPGFPPPAGQAIAFRAVLLVELAGGLIARASEFYDLYGVLVQLGVLPPPGGTATPVAAS